MARVNLENRLFADDRLGRIGRRLIEADMNLKAKAVAIGTLAIIWRVSQDERRVEATKEDFAYWLDEDENGPVIDTILGELLRAKYIEPCGANFKICGNAEQIDSQTIWRDRAKKGGEANRQRLRKKRANKDNNLNTQTKTGELEAKLEAELEAELVAQHQDKHKLNQYNSIQFNSIQLNSIQKKNLNTFTDHSHDPLSDGVNPPVPEKNSLTVLANSQKPEKAKKEKSPGEVSDGSKVWTAYAMAYEQRMRVTPIRNAKQNSLCSQLVQRLGVENAVKIAAFYLTHPNSYYMQNKYPLGLLVKDCEGIYTEFQRGEYVTADRARKASISQQNSSVLEKFIAKQKERGSHGL